MVGLEYNLPTLFHRRLRQCTSPMCSPTQSTAFLHRHLRQCPSPTFTAHDGVYLCHISLGLLLFASADFWNRNIVHPSKMVPEIVKSPEAFASLPFASILGTIDSPILVDVSNMTIEGSDGFTTVLASRRLMPMDQR